MIIDNPQTRLSPLENSKTDLGILSCLPIEILQEMMDYLSIMDTRMLNLTGRNLHSIIETTIQAKTQRYLELLVCDLLKDDQNFICSSKKTKFNHEKAKSFSDNTEQRCQALRESITGLFSKGFLEDIQSLSPCLVEDPLLVPYMSKALIKNTNRIFLTYNNKNEKISLLFFHILDIRQTIENYYICFEDNLEVFFLESFINFIANQSIVNLQIIFKKSDLEALNSIVKSIKNNKGIKSVQIAASEYWNEKDLSEFHQICSNFTEKFEMRNEHTYNF